jgi:hypothetical protein
VRFLLETSLILIQMLLQMRQLPVLFGILLFLISCEREEPARQLNNLQLVSVSVGSSILSLDQDNPDMPSDQPLVLRFSQAVDKESVESNILLRDEAMAQVSLNFSLLDNDKSISASPLNKLLQSKKYFIRVSDGLKGAKGEIFPGIEIPFTTLNPPLRVKRLEIDGQIVNPASRITGINFRPVIKVSFSEKVSVSMIAKYSTLTSGGVSYSLLPGQQNDSILYFSPSNDLFYYRKARFSISANLASELGKLFEEYSFEFFTRLDETPKFPVISDEVLLTLVQRQTFRYFWDFAHPVSGLSRERNTSDQTVTSGGSGFGIMALLVGIERGFISRSEGIEQLEKIVGFLDNSERFHGAWPHWLNGTTGKVIPFSPDDNGGDIVETSYLAMGLLAARQYLDAGDHRENELIGRITALWEGIEWDWYTQGNNSLTWHWSPVYGFQKNHIIRGWNEALITYVLAASSPTHSISKEVYTEGWPGSNMTNGRDYYGINLPLGPSFGGPLFFEHYTFLGINPATLNDYYSDYSIQVKNHTLINRQHCIVNPYNYVGYSDKCWGLTASDGDRGYSAHSPTNDRGVVSPTAAISSIPFTPAESIDALRHFYYMLGDRVWGQYGFYDAFNVTAGWFGTSNIAIDQGPIILMIENYRTGLLWNLFMSAPEVRSGLDKLGFTY